MGRLYYFDRSKCRRHGPMNIRANVPDWSPFPGFRCKRVYITESGSW